jgi:ABC-type phosphonate transport system ATPase subunit
MQQRLQIARNLVSSPRLVFMDEPTGGLDVSVQARLLDLLRGLVRELVARVAAREAETLAWLDEARR